MCGKKNTDRKKNWLVKKDIKSRSRIREVCIEKLQMIQAYLASEQEGTTAPTWMVQYKNIGIISYYRMYDLIRG